jgi:hypothetical protein
VFVGELSVQRGQVQGRFKRHLGHHVAMLIVHISTSRATFATVECSPSGVSTCDTELEACRIGTLPCSCGRCSEASEWLCLYL